MPKRGGLSASPGSNHTRTKSTFGSSSPAGIGSEGLTGTTCFAELPSRLRVATASIDFRLARLEVVTLFRSPWKCAIGPLLTQACFPTKTKKQ